MSSGNFVRAVYQAQYAVDSFHPVRVQPETLSLTLTAGGQSLTNALPVTQEATNPISATVSGSRRALGLKTALVRLSWASTVPDGYDPAGILTVPLLTFPIRSVAAGATGTYLGLPVEVVGKTPESVN